jgi:hypothetical protein
MTVSDFWYWYVSCMWHRRYRCSPASTKPKPGLRKLGFKIAVMQDPPPTLATSPSPLLHLLWSDLVLRHILIRHSSKIAGALISHYPLGTHCPRGSLQLPASYPTHFLLIFSSSSLFFWLVYMTCARYRPCWISRSLLLLHLSHCYSSQIIFAPDVHFRTRCNHAVLFAVASGSDAVRTLHTWDRGCRLRKVVFFLCWSVEKSACGKLRARILSVSVQL